MSEPVTNEHITTHEPHSHASASVFTDADWAGFQAEDFAAGKAVVLLMLSIFTTGVFIYSIVAYWVIFYSHG